MDLRPSLREVGQGPPVVCLHSNASTSSQWRSLGDLLADRFHVIAVDGYGAGKSPPWPIDRALRLDDEVALLEPVLAQAGAPLHLVGHSYGGAVALRAALANPGRVASIVVYEPTVFHLLVDAGADPLQSAGQGIWRAASAAAAAAERGDDFGAAEIFIDYWMGAGAFRTMPASRQPAIAASVRNVGGWLDALFADTTPPSAYAALDVPVLYLWGDSSPKSARAVAERLTRTLPRVTSAPQPGLGHMAPITHPDVINPQIRAFLERAA